MNLNKLLLRMLRILIISGLALNLPGVTFFNIEASDNPGALAQEQNVRIFFTPEGITLPPDRTISLMMDAYSDQISFARIDIAFNPLLIQLTAEIQTTDLLRTVIQKTKKATANSTGQITIILGLAPSDPPPTGIFEIAKLPFGAVTACPARTNISIIEKSVEIVDSINIMDLSFTSGSDQITLSPVPQECEVFLPLVESLSLRP